MSGTTRRKLTDYAGLAALVTAAGVVVFGVVDRMNEDDHNKRMARSLFNAGRDRIAVLEYRVAELEELCEGLEGAHSRPMVTKMYSLPAAMASPPPELDFVDAEIEDPADDEEIAELPPPGSSVSFDQIQQIVDDGETYEATK